MFDYAVTLDFDVRVLGIPNPIIQLTPEQGSYVLVMDTDAIESVQRFMGCNPQDAVQSVVQKIRSLPQCQRVNVFYQGSADYVTMPLVMICFDYGNVSSLCFNPSYSQIDLFLEDVHW